MPVTVVSSTADMLGIWHRYQRKLFYAKGLFWLFYGNGSQAAFKTSVDGINWSSETTFGHGEQGRSFSVIYDGGDYVHIAFANGTPVFYRRGFLNTDGTITWDSWINTGTDDANYPHITLDSEGYPWIGYRNTNDNHPYVVKSSKKDGTWATTSDFPYCLSTTVTGPTAAGFPVALTNGKVFVLYSNVGEKVYGKLYDGSWKGEETLSEYGACGDLIDAVAEGDAIHFVYVVYGGPLTNYIRYNKRNPDGTLNTEVTIEPLPFEAGFSVSIDKSTGILYLFYSGVSSVRLRRKVGNSFESPIDYITGEGGEGVPIKVFSEKYARYIGVAWQQSTDLRFQTYVILPSVLKNTPNSGL